MRCTADRDGWNAERQRDVGVRRCGRELRSAIDEPGGRQGHFHQGMPRVEFTGRTVPDDLDASRQRCRGGAPRGVGPEHRRFRQRAQRGLEMPHRDVGR